VQKVSAACTNFYTRRSPRVKNSIITILAAIACRSLRVKLPSANLSKEVAWRLDEGMVQREKQFKGTRRH
jgi:hypothetical protein